MKRLILGLALASVLSCAKSQTGPVAGTLTVTLASPSANSGNDGAILLTVTGPAAPGGASAASGLRLFAPATFGTTNHFVLTGTIGAGPILTLNVTDVGQAASYTATIQQVAALTFQLRALGGYSLKVSSP